MSLIDAKGLRRLGLVCTALLAVGLGAPSLARADKLPSKPRPVRAKAKAKPPKVEVSIGTEAKLQRATIELPRTLLTKLEALRKTERRRRKRGALWLPGGRTMIAGVALVVGLALAGLLLGRRKPRRALVGPLLLIAAGALLWASHPTLVQADTPTSKVTLSKGRYVTVSVDGNSFCDGHWEK